MDLIFFSIGLRFKMALLKLRNWINLLVFIILLLLSAFYGFLAGFFHNLTFTESDIPINPDDFLPLMFTGIFILSFFRLFFPNYNILTRSIPKYYPVSKTKAIFIEILNDFIVPGTFHILVFLIIFQIVSEHSTFQHFVAGLAVIFSPMLLRRILQTLLEYKLKFTVLQLISAIILLAISVCLVIFLPVFYTGYLWVAAVVFVLLFLANVIIESTVYESKKAISFSFTQSFGFSAKLLMNNKAVRISLLMGLGFKVVFLGLAVFSEETGSDFLSGGLLRWWLISPLVVFTYVFNNLWGYFRSTWLSTQLASGRFIDFAKTFLKMISIPLAIDFVLAMLFSILLGHAVFGIIFYVSTSVLLFSIAITTSAYFPNRIEKAVGMKSNTSPVSSFLAMFFVAIPLLLTTSNWAWLLLPVYFGLAYIPYVFARDAYKEKASKIFIKLYHSEK